MTGLGKKIADIRREFAGHELSESSVDEDPVKQFDKWISDAVLAEVPEVNAMSLATVDASGQPSVRIVLLKGFDENGFVFFTNYASRKARDLSHNDKAAICFYWNDLGRQMRIRGTVEKISSEASDAYFASRPRGGQLGAWASPQSEPVSREMLQANELKFQEEFKNRDVPRPSHWGGYVLKPTEIEFWQGRPNRMHDRILYELSTNGWSVKRLAP